METKKKIIIAGGGLVGATAASVFADAGHPVELYELRSDPRGEGADPGRSINLTLSHRGRQALKRIGIEEECLNAGVKDSLYRVYIIDYRVQGHARWYPASLICRPVKSVEHMTFRGIDYYFPILC